MSDFSKYVSLTNSKNLIVESLGIISGNQIVDVKTLIDTKRDSIDSYTKAQADALLANKADATNVHSATQTDSCLGIKADKLDVNAELALKSDKADTYTKLSTYSRFEADGLLILKSDKTDTYTQLSTIQDLNQMDYYYYKVTRLMSTLS